MDQNQGSKYLYPLLTKVDIKFNKKNTNYCFSNNLRLEKIYNDSYCYQWVHKRLAFR